MNFEMHEILDFSGGPEKLELKKCLLKRIISVFLASCLGPLNKSDVFGQKYIAI